MVYFSALVLVMNLCEKLLMEHAERLNGNIGVLHRAVLYCLLSSSVNVRRKCFAVLKRIVGSLSGNTIARALLKELQNFLDSGKAQVCGTLICTELKNT